MTALTADSSAEYGQICWTRSYFFVRMKKDMVPLNAM